MKLIIMQFSPRPVFLPFKSKGKVVPVLELSTTPWRRIGGMEV